MSEVVVWVSELYHAPSKSLKAVALDSGPYLYYNWPSGSEILPPNLQAGTNSFGGKEVLLLGASLLVVRFSKEVWMQVAIRMEYRYGILQMYQALLWL